MAILRNFFFLDLFWYFRRFGRNKINSRVITLTFLVLEWEFFVTNFCRLHFSPQNFRFFDSPKYPTAQISARRKLTKIANQLFRFKIKFDKMIIVINKIKLVWLKVSNLLILNFQYFFDIVISTLPVRVIPT